MGLEKVKVMIADDSMFARKKLINFISTLGVAEVLEAADGEEAVEKYKASKPNVVFMDIVMPKKTGIEAVKEIVEFDPAAKVIMASSVGTQNHLRDAIMAGASDFIQKPISNDQIQKILENTAKELK